MLQDFLDTEPFFRVLYQDLGDQVLGLRRNEHIIRETETQAFDLFIDFLNKKKTLTSSDSNGGLPYSSVYMMMPQAHIST